MKKSLQFQIYEAMANKLMPYKLKYLTKISLEITEKHNFMVFSNDFCKHFKKGHNCGILSEFPVMKNH